jgi:hypothetical protein
MAEKKAEGKHTTRAKGEGWKKVLTRLLAATLCAVACVPVGVEAADTLVPVATWDELTTSFSELGRQSGHKTDTGDRGHSN